MGVSRVLLPGGLFESHKNVTLLLTRKKNFDGPLLENLLFKPFPGIRPIGILYACQVVRGKT
jgi:hypothetical protein